MEEGRILFKKEGRCQEIRCPYRLNRAYMWRRPNNPVVDLLHDWSFACDGESEYAYSGAEIDMGEIFILGTKHSRGHTRGLKNVVLWLQHRDYNSKLVSDGLASESMIYVSCPDI